MKFNYCFKGASYCVPIAIEHDKSDFYVFELIPTVEASPQHLKEPVDILFMFRNSVDFECGTTSGGKLRRRHNLDRTVAGCLADSAVEASAFFRENGNSPILPIYSQIIFLNRGDYFGHIHC